MKTTPDPNWTPDPQLLAAYFDGELEGRDDLADVRLRLEAWLEQHPEAADAWTQHHQLQKLWLDTTPAEPTAATWNQALDRMDAECKRPTVRAARRRPWLAVGIVAASVLVLLGVVFGLARPFLTTKEPAQPIVKAPQPMPPEVENVEVLQIATADEITILRIEGADIDAVIVGTFPVSGPLDLASSGEVCITCNCPRVVVRQDPPHRPMVWARLDAE